jgi:hypothetical protein
MQAPPEANTGGAMAQAMLPSALNTEFGGGSGSMDL